MKHLTILNKNAGGYTAQEQRKLHQILSEIDGEIVATPDLASLEYQLQKHRDFHPDILGIGGGDGTASQTLSLVHKVWGEFPRYLAPFAMGTMNNWAIPAGASDGLVDKLKLMTGIGDTKPVQVGRYITQCAKAKEEPHTEALALLDVNGRKGFNLGFGIVPKLVWTYYGKSIEQYQQLREELKYAKPDEYDAIFNGISSAQQNLKLIDIVTLAETSRKLGGINAVKAAVTAIKGVLFRSSKEYQFFSQPMNADIYLDGEKVILPSKPLGIYIASYEQSNIGLPLIAPRPSPGARSVAGKMEVLLTYATPQEIVNSIPNIFAGKPIQNTHYYHARELRLESETPLIGEVDADFVFGQSFTVKYDQILKLISLKKETLQEKK